MDQYKYLNLNNKKNKSAQNGRSPVYSKLSKSWGEFKFVYKMRHSAIKHADIILHSFEKKSYMTSNEVFF